METTRMWAVLPAKDFADAKQRLAGVLSAAERRQLFRTMFADVLAALVATRSLDGIAVMTRDPEAAEMGALHGARILSEPANLGQTEAVSRAVSVLVADGIDGVATFPGDIPLADPAEIETALRHHSNATPPAMTIVPAHDRRGSNCIALSPPTLIEFQFGNDSFTPHLAAARAQQVEPTILDLPGLALDIDTPEDLRTLLARPGDTRTHAYLEDSGIASRLRTSSAIAQELAR
jgi:2-phospho-L-lactate guanylyltransferase